MVAAAKVTPPKVNWFAPPSAIVPPRVVPDTAFVLSPLVKVVLSEAPLPICSVPVFRKLGSFVIVPPPSNDTL